MSHLLVTNDFPPKAGGIQTYLWELWRRLPPGEVTVLTTSFPGDAAWDRQQAFRVVRSPARVLVPRRSLVDRINAMAAESAAGLVVLDPALPVGLVGPRLAVPYAVIAHGAEVAVPGRLPATRHLLARVVRGATGVIAAGGYPAAEVQRLAPAADIVNVPPGVDVQRFRPVDEATRQATRARLGVAEDAPLIVSASRLVPRKGMDVLIRALPHLVPHRPGLTLAIAGAGRDAGRLKTLAGKLGVAKRVRFLGRVPDGDLAALYGTADVFAMVCRNRWGRLEQEGFGIVFLEAAASGVAQVAGDSGGAAEAVVDGETGFVVREPTRPEAVARALRALLDDPALRASAGRAARRRAESDFDWGQLAATLHTAVVRWGG